MAGKMEHYYNGAWNDVSGFIIQIDKVPFINRNRDFTIITNDMKTNIVYEYNNSFSLNDKIRIWHNDNVIFAGYTQFIQNNWDNRYYELTIANDLSAFNYYKVEHNTLHSVIAKNGGDKYKYNPNDSNGHQNVQILWLLQCMFSIAGYSLDVSDVEDLVWDTWTGVQILIKHFCLDEGMLYCLNQDVATSYRNIDNITTLSYYTNKITFLDFLNIIFPIFGFGLAVTGYDSYKLVKEGTLYSPNNNEIFSYKATQIRAENEMAPGKYSPFIVKSYVATPSSISNLDLRNYYYDVDPAKAKNVTCFWQASEGVTFDSNGNYTNSNINILEDTKNLLIGSRINLPNGNLTPDFVLAYELFAQLSPIHATTMKYRQRKLDTAYTKYEITMPINTEYKGANQNMIDLNSDTLTSEIVQEQYVPDYPNPFE